jgi:hypothetical protein
MNVSMDCFHVKSETTRGSMNSSTVFEGITQLTPKLNAQLLKGIALLALVADNAQFTWTNSIMIKGKFESNDL